MAGHRSLEPAVVVRIHPGQFLYMPFLSPVCARLSLLLVGPFLLLPFPAGGLQTASDSAQLRERSENAQRDFERIHRMRLPFARRDPPTECDERLGPICLRFENGFDWDLFPEDPSVVHAREELLGTLEGVGRSLPGDRWVLGQRIRYLGDVGRWREAELLARECEGGPGWWCDAALGFVLHRSGNPEEAWSVFSTALQEMDPETARSWTDPSLLLDYPERKWLRARGDLTELEARTRFWRFADPLFLTPGNERLPEHFARVFGSYLYDGSAMTLDLPWSSGLERLLLRYGFVAGWGRLPPRIGESTRPSVVEHHHPESRGLLPPLQALEDPSALPEGVWLPEDERPQSASAPVRAPLIVDALGQTGVFRRDGEILVFAAFRPPTDTLLLKRRPDPSASPESPGKARRPPLWEPPSANLPRDTLAGLFLLADSGLEAPFSAIGEGGEGFLQLSAPPGRYLLSLELWNPFERWGARLRHGVSALPVQPDLPHLSDILLLRREGDLPETLADAVPRMLPGTHLPAGEPLTVAWEVYGLGGRREPFAFRISLVGEEAGLIRRVLNRIGLFREDPTLTLGWTEGGPDDMGPLFRAIDVDLPPLDPGRYVLCIEMDTPVRSKVLSRRRITVF
jgi:hypothetical protein